jgi:hypothetical protein
MFIKTGALFLAAAGLVSWASALNHVVGTSGCGGTIRRRGLQEDDDTAWVLSIVAGASCDDVCDNVGETMPVNNATLNPCFWSNTQDKLRYILEHLFWSGPTYT